VGGTTARLAEMLMATAWLGNGRSHSKPITVDDALEGYEIMDRGRRVRGNSVGFCLRFQRDQSAPVKHERSPIQRPPRRAIKASAIVPRQLNPSWPLTTC
jgi:hypothetical protein